MLLDLACSFLHIAVMTEVQQIVARIEALSKKTGASEVTLSGKLLGSGVELDRLRNGGSMTFKKAARVTEQLSALEAAA